MKMDSSSRMKPETIPPTVYQEENYENVLKNTMQDLIKYKEVLLITEDSKNEEIAEKEINQAKSSAPLDKLIENYNKAIAYALPGSNLLARAYANRSAVLTNSKMYEDSLKDIERALEIGYPDNLKAKLYARKAKNLLALNQKMSTEVKEAIDQAKLWIEQMDDNDTNKKKVLNNLNQLKTNKSIKKSVEEWDSSVFLPKTPDDNPKILRASGSIDIQQSEIFGRHIVATKDIKAGETIMVERFYAFMVKPDYTYRNCWNCSKYVYSGVPCNQCANVIYCNEKCREIAWQEYHDVECPVIAAILKMPKNFPNKFLISLKVLIKAIKEFGTIDALYEQVQKIDLINDSILKCFTENVYDDTKYASVYSLFRLKSNPPFTEAIAFFIVKIIYMLGITTEVLGKKYDNPTELVNNKWIFFLGNLLFRHLEIIDSNSFCISSNDRKGNLIESCGSVLLPLMSHCSHNCDRNTYPLAIGDIHLLFAAQSIKKGELISVNYGPCKLEQPASQRRLFIQENFHFWCQCSSCVNDWSINKRLPSCLKHPPRKAQNNLVKALKKFYSHDSTIKLLSQCIDPTLSTKQISGIIFDILAVLNVTGCDKYPCKELFEAKMTLFLVQNYMRSYI